MNTHDRLVRIIGAEATAKLERSPLAGTVIRVPIAESSVQVRRKQRNRQIIAGLSRHGPAGTHRAVAEATGLSTRQVQRIGKTTST